MTQMRILVMAERLLGPVLVVPVLTLSRPERLEVLLALLLSPLRQPPCWIVFRPLLKPPLRLDGPDSGPPELPEVL